MSFYWKVFPNELPSKKKFVQEEISAEEKSSEFICANLASIRTFKFHKYIFQLG